MRALRPLEVGDEITYSYVTAPDYVHKPPDVVAGCQPPPGEVLIVNDIIPFLAGKDL
jgi:hypothetical protein